MSIGDVLRDDKGRWSINAHLDRLTSRIVSSAVPLSVPFVSSSDPGVPRDEKKLEKRLPNSTGQSDACPERDADCGHTGKFRSDLVHQGFVSILLGFLAFEEKLDLNIARYSRESRTKQRTIYPIENKKRAVVQLKMSFDTFGFGFVLVFFVGLPSSGYLDSAQIALTERTESRRIISCRFSAASSLTVCRWQINSSDHRNERRTRNHRCAD